MSEKEKIAIIYTTFNRDTLMYQTIQAAMIQKRDEDLIFIGDQNPTKDKRKFFEQETMKKHCFYQPLPYDCGLSYARNALVGLAKAMNFEYCLLIADSIELTYPLSNLQPILKFMNDNPLVGIIGLKLEGRDINKGWEKNILRVTSNEGFVIQDSKNYLPSHDYLMCDIVRNFFLARTLVLTLSPWDNDLKLLEHEDFFYRIKKNKVCAILYTNSYSANYINFKPTEYKLLRDRMYKEFRNILFKKYNINMWITYVS